MATKKKAPKRAPKKSPKKSILIKKLPPDKLTDAEKIDEYMKAVKRLKPEIEAVREIIKNTSKEIGERIKWNAPSYYYKGQDMVTFNAWATDQVHLVFHHPAIVKIRSNLLEGDYPTRRMTYFNDMKEVKAKENELKKVMKELLKRINSE
jgi:uncharacterized protein YdhG (YjbR/CyaY superfamily)